VKREAENKKLKFELLLSKGSGRAGFFSPPAHNPADGASSISSSAF
jgi:hypothetical protein